MLWVDRGMCSSFQQLKEYLSHPPIMSSLGTDEVLFAYIAVAPHVVSLVLIWVDSGRQRPVYYVSKSLHEAKIRYLPLEKAILAVVHGTWKLPHYFQAHTMVILTQLPFKAILQSVDYTRRIAKWGTILGAFEYHAPPLRLPSLMVNSKSRLCVTTCSHNRLVVVYHC